MQMHIRDIQIRGVFANDAQRSEAIAYVDESIRRYERLSARRTSTEKPSRSVSEQADDLLMLAPFASSSAHDLPFNHPLKAASSVDELRKAVEPFVLFRVSIDANSQAQITPCSTPKNLPQDRTQRFLVEVHNPAKSQGRLSIDTTGAKLNTATPSNGCEIGIVENLLSTAQLTGEEFDWKLLELRWSQPGSYDVEASIESLKTKNTSHCTLRFPVSTPSTELPKSR